MDKKNFDTTAWIVKGHASEGEHDAKQVLYPLSLEVRRIHAYPNDRILLYKEYADQLGACPVCSAS